jgi:hypothetical protein
MMFFWGDVSAVFMMTEDDMRKPSRLMRIWLLAAAIGVTGAVIHSDPADAQRRMGGARFHGGGGHWHGGGGHWHGGWRGHGGCWNCGWGWGLAGFGTGLAIGSGWGWGWGAPVYAYAPACGWQRRVIHTSRGTFVRRVRVCW